jgi:hypothetical protein
MIDQLVIGTVGSYDEYEANVKERQIEAPKKKSIKETVPFSNQTYDFSGINGEVYWEARTLEYVFEITGNTAEEMEEKKQRFVSWVMNVVDAELHDPFIPDYHFLATFESISFDDEVEKTTISVEFAAYPYKIANSKTVRVLALSANEVSVNILNRSDHRIAPTFISDTAFELKMNGTSYSVSAGTTFDSSFMFAQGNNAIAIRSASGTGTVRIEFYEEVF